MVGKPDREVEGTPNPTEAAKEVAAAVSTQLEIEQLRAQGLKMHLDEMQIEPPPMHRLPQNEISEPGPKLP